MVVQGFVYPREEPGAWRKQFAALLARSGIRRVAVFGHWKNPANFLRERKVAFEDLGDDWPAQPDARTLYLASGVIKDGKDAPLRVPEAFVETPGRPAGSLRALGHGGASAGRLPDGRARRAASGK